jgi:hypothetical protein
VVTAQESAAVSGFVSSRLARVWHIWRPDPRSPSPSGLFQTLHPEHGWALRKLSRVSGGRSNGASAGCVRTKSSKLCLVVQRANRASGDGGPGTQALMNSPLGIAIGADGSLYVTQYDGNRVRRLALDGTTSTVVGNGTAGNSGDAGPATEAQLSNPHSVDVAPNGTLYITDEGNDRLRMVTPDGIIHSLTGGGSQESNEYVPAQDAAFRTPRLVNIEPSGQVLGT